MPKDHPSNLFDRHQNKKALAKKKRAKDKHLRDSNSENDNGLTSQFENQDALSDLPIALIAEVRNGIFKINYNHELLEAKLGSDIPFECAKHLVVGDKVAIKIGENQSAIYIQGRHPRTSYLARMRGDSTRFSIFADDEHTVASNVDAAVIVATTAEPDFHPNLVDRYLIIAQNGGVLPVICLNKCDLTTDRPDILSYYRINLGIPVIEVSAQTGAGIEDLKNLLRYKVSVLVGNSGVGKSTITNLFNSDLNIKTQEISSKNKEGRHTTTTTNLYEWAENSYIIDTPGIRSLGVTHIQRDSLKYYFPEFEIFQKNCKYNDCIHDHEPMVDCGVKMAIKNDQINKYRYDSYKRMLEDLL